MHVPRPHRSALTVASVVALALGSAPFVGFARAAAPSVAVYEIPSPAASCQPAATHQDAACRVIGPNAGYPYNEALPNSIDMGVRGNTPLAVVTLDADELIQTAKLRFTGITSPLGNFAANDGFALYRDVDPEGATGPDGNFREEDYQAGRVSTGYTLNSEPGYVEATITGSPSATGATTYFLTAHPADTQVADRVINATIPQNGIQTESFAFPIADLVIPPTTIDSTPLAAPRTSATASTGGFYTRAQNLPPAEDVLTYGYEAAEKDGSIRFFAFFNNEAPVVNGAALYSPRADGAIMRPEAPTSSNEIPAIWDMTAGSTATTKNVSIGNGTGITKSVTTAINNQKSDDLWVLSIDRVGNVSAKTKLTGTGTGNGQVGNDVTAPTYDTYAVTFPAGTTYNASTDADDIQVHGNLGANGGGWTSGKQYARLFVKDPQTGAQTNPTDWGVSTAAGTATEKDTPVNPATADATYAEGAKLYAEAYGEDSVGNQTDHSATAPAPQSTTFIVKDTVVPHINSVTLKQDGGPTINDIDPGDVVHVEFSEPVQGIDTATAGTPCNPGTIANVSTVGAGSATCVNKMLRGVLRDGFKWIVFGTNPGFAWGPGNTSADITVGDAPSAQEQDCDLLNMNGCEDMITINDFVCPASANPTTPCGTGTVTSPIKDTNNNAIVVDEYAIGQLGVLPADATTVDVAGGPKFGQPDSRDGALESVVVQLNKPIHTPSLSTARTSFHLSSSGESVTPATVSADASKTTLTLTLPSTITPSFWQSGATPTVELRTDQTCSSLPCTGLKDASQVNVDPFTIVARDTASPSVVSVKTKDKDGDGHLDQLVVTYSEPVKHGSANENPCGYTSSTSAYHDSAPAGTTQCLNGPSGAAGSFLVIDDAATGTTPSSQTVLKLKPNATACSSGATNASTCDTNATPQVTFQMLDESLVTEPEPDLDGVEKPITDVAGNAMPCATTADHICWSNTAANTPDPTLDGAGPAIVLRVTKDRDFDGLVDEVDLGFSETIMATRLGAANFEITEPAHSMQDIDTLAPIDSRNIRVAITETELGGAGDTGVKPKVKYTAIPFESSPGVTDGNGLTGADGNPVPADANGVQTTDGAGPAIMTASFNYSGQIDTPGTNETGGTPGEPAPNSGLKLKVFFSETLSADPAFAKFQMVQEPFAAATPTAVTAVTGNAAEKILTFAAPSGAPTYSLFDPGSVKMIEAGVASDGTNTSSQIAAVPFFGYPTAKLDLTGVVGSNPGYSIEQRGFTGADGNGGVRKWLFVIQDADSPDPTPPANMTDPRWALTRPDEWTVTADGDYKAWLWTADAAGNITHKDGQATGAPVAEDAITVLFTPPAIENATFVDVQTKTTMIRDGDTVRVTAKAVGADAAQWGSGTTCNVANLWIDYSQVLSNTTKNKVAPSKCTLNSVASPPYRSLEFPYVTVAGTTQYPVGTVIRTSSSDPGWIIEDSPTGLVKRHFLSVAARRTWLIKDGSVITTTGAVLGKIKTGPTKMYRDGALVRASGTSTLYVIDNGKKRAVTNSAATFYRYTSKMVYSVAATELNRVPTGPRMTGNVHVPGTYVRKGTTSSYFVILRAPNGKLFRREVSRYALGTLVPSTHIVPGNTWDLQLQLDDYVRGYRDGHMIKRLVGNNVYEYAVISRGRPRWFDNSSIFNTMGFLASNASTYTTLGFGYVRGGSWTDGTDIDFTDMSVTISVKNVAGKLVTKVLQLTALGTKETNPYAGLPTTVPARP